MCFMHIFCFFLLGLPFYDSSKDFTCFDGSLTVPFNSVNDDYCDCADGSDEPGMVAISIFCQMVVFSGFVTKLLW